MKMGVWSGDSDNPQGPVVKEIRIAHPDVFEFETWWLRIFFWNWTCTDVERTIVSRKTIIEESLDFSIKTPLVTCKLPIQ